MNAFHVLGGILALWALLVSFLGVTRENFPASKRSERLVAVISVVLVIAAISSAIITAANEGDEEKGGKSEAATVLPF
jgi:Mn2+/Fe2+ NRAMP family transporter